MTEIWRRVGWSAVAVALVCCASMVGAAQSTKTVGPLLSFSTWAQWEPYNKYCGNLTQNGASNSCPAGCNAIALAQLLWYWSHPATVYLAAGGPCYPYLAPAFDTDGAFSPWVPKPPVAADVRPPSWIYSQPGWPRTAPTTNAPAEATLSVPILSAPASQLAFFQGTPSPSVEDEQARLVAAAAVSIGTKWGTEYSYAAIDDIVAALLPSVSGKILTSCIGGRAAVSHVLPYETDAIPGIWHYSTARLAILPLLTASVGTDFYPHEYQMTYGQLFSIIRANLDSGQPVLVSLASARPGLMYGHTVIIDGYRGSPGAYSYHLNMGWGPGYDQWQSESALDGSSTGFTITFGPGQTWSTRGIDAAILDIHPTKLSQLPPVADFTIAPGDPDNYMANLVPVDGFLHLDATNPWYQPGGRFAASRKRTMQIGSPLLAYAYDLDGEIVSWSWSTNLPYATVAGSLDEPLVRFESYDPMPVSGSSYWIELTVTDNAGNTDTERKWITIP